MIYKCAAFQDYFFSKLITRAHLKILLHHLNRILDKTVFNQVKAMDNVIDF